MKIACGSSAVACALLVAAWGWSHCLGHDSGATLIAWGKRSRISACDGDLRLTIGHRDHVLYGDGDERGFEVRSYRVSAQAVRHCDQIVTRDFIVFEHISF